MKRSLVIGVAFVVVACGGGESSSGLVGGHGAGGAGGGVNDAAVTSAGGGSAGGSANGGASSCVVGAERCACYGNGTCDAGLTCASDLCVKLGAGGATGASGATGTGGAQATGGATGGGAGGVGGATSTGGVPATGGTAATLPDGSPCVPLASNATDVYVDQRFGGLTSTGVASCPFTTIRAGLTAAASLPGTRTVHVAGATPALVYVEAGAVAVNAKIVLSGDGPGKTTISASGACGSATCAVMVNGGGTLDGFTVVSSGGDGVVTALTSPAPVVKNAAASGSKGNGVLALGAVVLGPGIVANNNGGQGVSSTGTGIVHIVSTGGANAFDNNGANGIDVEGATLEFDGGHAGGNAFNGIRFGAAGPPTGTHTITSLVTENNKNTGISAFNGQNIKLRSSNLLTNGNYGLYYSYIAGYALDIGVTGGAGGNVFGGATVATRNPKAGMYLCHSRGTGTLPGEGNTFASCPPTQTSLSGCDASPASYTDVAYAPTVAGNPVVASTCTVGP